MAPNRNPILTLCRAREWVVKEFNLAHGGRLSLFETIIRIVGGLVAAYDASGDLFFLQKAQELAQKLQPNFPGGGKGTCLTSQPTLASSLQRPATFTLMSGIIHSRTLSVVWSLMALMPLMARRLPTADDS